MEPGKLTLKREDFLRENELVKKTSGSYWNTNRKGEEIMKTDKGQENMDLEEAFLIGWQKETRPYRILAYIMLAISALYFVYLIYEDKSLLNMLPLIIPIGFLPGEIFLGNFLQKKRK
ncbi:hypothetical protein [uncultured Dialister sp.]|uniref:hypothetical protein n=1 Tax=uncultured Dialister sp. TaxID=278064 RepID=UPI0027DB3695|nr:hypothetical protein [uncultured Dialister sp.]